MIQAPANKVIVSPKTKYIKNITDVMKRAAIQNGSTVDPTECVNIVGEIVSLPLQITDNHEYTGYSVADLRVGDMAIFSYRVIYDLIMRNEHDEPAFRNRIWYEGKELFTCDIRHLFGVIRDGEIIMVNGWVMLTEIQKSNIILPAALKKIKAAARSQVMHIGNSRTHTKKINSNQGDYIYFNSNHGQHYQIGDKKFIILQQERILGKEV